MPHRTWIVWLVTIALYLLARSTWGNEINLHSSRHKIKLGSLSQDQIKSVRDKNLHIGMTAFYNDQYAAAELPLKQALGLTMTPIKADRLIPHEDKWLLDLMTTLGFCYEAEHKYEQSQQTFLQALDFAEKHYGMGHINVSAQLSCLGDVCFDKKDFSKAIEYYSRSLHIIERAEGCDLNPVSCVAYPSFPVQKKNN